MVNNKSFNKFMILWLGELISSIGSGLTSFGLGVYVYKVTGKVSAMTIITLLAFLPGLLLRPLAGVIADRYDRRLLMIIGDSLSALGLVYILICMINGEAQLWQICIGVTISSIFSTLLEPAYNATITDLLTEDQYAKASGLVQIANSSKLLISPMIAGLLLAAFDIKLLLIIDICTFFVTVASTIVVRKSVGAKEYIKKENTSILTEFKDGWKAITQKKGILLLVIITSVITFFLAFIQTLSMPMGLAFMSSAKFGVCETICATGMLISSLLIGIKPIKKNYSKILSVSLFFNGVFMTVFGLRESVILLCVSGFLFFATLPFANTSIDVLVRSNIENNLQGRAWGLMGFISQLGYVVAYCTIGPLSDKVFTPLLLKGGALADSVGKILGVGPGRGIGLLIVIGGVFISITSIILYNVKSIKKLEVSDVL